MQNLRIFLCSPSDVAAERVVAGRVVERIAQQFARFGAIDLMQWESEPIQATAPFQGQIPRACEADICIFLLWSRLGTPVIGHDGRRYASGTEYEFLDALTSHREKGIPDILFYRKTEDIACQVRMGEAEILQSVRQWRFVEEFMARWFRGEDGSFTLGFHEFLSAASFETLLETHLRRLIPARLHINESDETEAEPRWQNGSPYRGLDPFEIEHALIYWGRTAAVHDVIQALRRQAQNGRPFVLVLGPSGAGKSSLLRAGVLPLLITPGVIEGVRHWRHAILRPADITGDLAQGLALALTGPLALPGLAADRTTIDELAASIRESPQAAVLLVRHELARLARSIADEQRLADVPLIRFALVLDQFEEIFADNRTAAERAAFMRAVSALARDGAVWVLAALRSDFYARCVDLPELMALKDGAGQFDLQPPTLSELGQMISGPARMAGLRFEERDDCAERLDDTLATAAACAPAALPLLEFVLEALYRNADHGLLTYAAYESLGGIEGALAAHAETVFAALAPAVQAALPQVLAALLTVDFEADGHLVQRRPPLAGLEQAPEAGALIHAFTAGRLLTLGKNDDGAATVGLSHEALVRRWPRAQAWIAENEALLQTRARIGSAAALWRAEGRPREFLLPAGHTLDDGRLLLGNAGAALNYGECEYIEASLANFARIRARRRAARVCAGVVVVLCAISGVLYWKAFVSEHVEYYAAFGKRWGLPVGIGRLTEDQVRHRESSYKFFRRGWLGSTTHFKIIDGFGDCAAYSQVVTYLADTSKNNSTSKRECEQFFEEMDGKAVTEEDRDRAGRTVYSFRYLNHEANVAVYTNKDGYVLQSGIGSASTVRILRADKGELAGFEIGFRITDSEGIPQPRIDGSYGLDLKLNAAGCITGVTYIGKGGYPAPNKFGINESKIKVDSFCNVLELIYEPAFGSKIARETASYDTFGNPTEFRYYDRAGHLTTLLSDDEYIDTPCATGRMGYDGFGRMKSFECFDSAERRLYSRSRNYNRLERSEITEYKDKNGNVSLRIKGIYNKIADVIRSDCLDNLDRLTNCNDGSARTDFSYDARGNLVEKKVFDASGVEVFYVIQVADVVPKSQAEKIGLKKDDVVLSYDGQTFEIQDLRARTTSTDRSSVHHLVILRDGEALEYKVSGGLLGIRPSAYRYIHVPYVLPPRVVP
jgi:YD repeat-containing protein